MDWYLERPGRAATPAVAADGTIYVVIGRRLYAVNPDGSERWCYPAESELEDDLLAFYSPIGEEGTIFVAVKSTPRGRLHAVTPEGERRALREFDYDWIVHTAASPSAFYLCTDAQNLDQSRVEIRAFNADLEPLWSSPYEYPGFLNVACNPAIDGDGVIYVAVRQENAIAGSGPCDLLAIDASGTLKWSFDFTPFTSGAINDLILAEADLGDGSPAGMVFVGYHQHGSAPRVGALGPPVARTVKLIRKLSPKTDRDSFQKILCEIGELLVRSGDNGREIMDTLNRHAREILAVAARDPELARQSRALVNDLVRYASAGRRPATHLASNLPLERQILAATERFAASGSKKMQKDLQRLVRRVRDLP